MAVQEIPSDFKWLFLVGPVWIMAACTFQAIRRKRAGLPIFMPKTPTAFERQTWISVGPNAFFAVRNCGWIRVTETAVSIGVHFPFNLAVPRFLTEGFGIEADMRLEDILDLEERQSALLGSGLTIRYRAVGTTRASTIWTARRDTLARKIANMRRKRGATG